MTEETRQALNEHAISYATEDLSETETQVIQEEVDALIHGADWYRNNVWHEISEDPTKFDSPFLLINSSTCDLFKCDYLDVFKNVAKKFDKWAYIEDLLPDNV